jgi:hypothetical protein
MTAPDLVARLRMMAVAFADAEGPQEEIEMFRAAAAALEAAQRDVAEARRLAEYERSRVKLSMVYPNWHEPFPWVALAAPEQTETPAFAPDGSPLGVTEEELARRSARVRAGDYLTHEEAMKLVDAELAREEGT